MKFSPGQLFLATATSLLLSSEPTPAKAASLERHLQATFATARDVPAGYNLKCTDPAAPDCIPCEVRELPEKRRIRREVRDMPKEQWDTFVFCMWEMKSLTMEEGQAKYGPLFKTQDWFVSYHAVATMSERGDQGHGAAILMSFHGTFMLMLETTLLAIAEAEGRQLDGLPYWWNLDDPSTSVLTDEFFGTHPGLGPNYEITDGPFANWLINKNYSIDDFQTFIVNQTDNGYAGHNGTLRALYNTLDTDYFAVFPNTNDDGEEETYTGFDYDTAMACVETPYDADDFTIFNFTYCIDNAGDVGPPNTLHSGTHAKVGGGFANPFVADPDAWGDFSDPVTSPNGPIFAPFHAMLDLLIQEWKHKNVEQTNITWGFPYALQYNYFDATTPIRDGINGNDTISSGWPAYWKDVGWAALDSPNAMRVVTHVQAHCYHSKDNADYVYVRYSNAPESFQGGIVESAESDSPMNDETTSPTPESSATDRPFGFGSVSTCIAILSLFLLAVNL